jgi:hypothetical protein
VKEMQFMLEIERKLYADLDGNFRRSLRARLLAIQSRLQHALRQQQVVAVNREIHAGLKAVEAAIALLRRYGG